MPGNSHRVELRLLGGAGLRGPQGAELQSVLAQPKRFALLAYLALGSRGQPLRREALMALFWPESDEQRARGALRTSLYFLRRSMGRGVFLDGAVDDIALADGAVWCDAVAFREAVESARWSAAVELYRGPLLPAFSVDDAPDWETWLALERERLARGFARALEGLATERERADDAAGAREAWARLAAAEPYNGRVAVGYMRALAATGDRAGAIEHAASFQARLRDEIGTEPDAEVLVLLDEMKAAAAPPRRRDTAVPAAPRGGGNAATESAEAQAPACTRLPVPPTPMLGRGAELAAVLGMLGQDACRLLTLTGTGGIGKTRLALAAAHAAADCFPDGVCFVDLAPLTDPAAVLRAVAAALGVRQNEAVPLPALLARFLAPRRVLLVLDNFEHLLDAAPDIASLLASAPTIRVLATSREPLRLQAEHEQAVAPLARDAAVELFAMRARAIRADFELGDRTARVVSAICARLDGLPLPIELAAARIRLLPPEQILARLDRRLSLLTAGARDQPARHRTLRAAIRWSHDLLSEDERVLFRRLAVFVGGAAFPAVEAVCAGGHGPARDLLGGIASLVDKSMLVASSGVDGEVRVSMLETIHEFAREQLERSGDEAEAIRRHAEYYLALAETMEPGLLDAADGRGLALLQAEQDNLRETIRRDLAAGEVERAARLGAALWRFWFLRGHLHEGRHWLARILAVDGVSPATRARVLFGAGTLATRQLDLAAAEPLLEQSLAVAREREDVRLVPRVLNALGVMAWMRGQPARAEALFEECMRRLRELGDAQALRMARTNLGISAKDRGDYARAESLHAETLAFARAANDTLGAAAALHNLGSVAWLRGDAHRARGLLRESLSLSRQAGSLTHAVATLAELANVEASTEAPARTARLFAAAEAGFAAIGAHIELPADREQYDRCLASVRGRMDAASWRSAWEEGQGMTTEQAIAFALAG